MLLDHETELGFEEKQKDPEEQVQHSPNFEKVKGYYKKKLWKLEQVHNAVGRWITEDEFEEITGEQYI